MKKSELAKAIKSVLAEGMPNLKKPTKFETQNDTPEMTRVRKKLHAIQDRYDQFKKDVKAKKFSPETKKATEHKILDDRQAIFAELQKLAKEAKDKKKEKLDESAVRQAIREVLAEEVEFKEGDKCLALLRGSAADGYEECTILGMDPSGVAVVQNKDGFSDEVYTKELKPIGGKRSIKEEGQNITLALSAGEASAILDALASSNLENNISKAGDMQGAGGQILANLNRAKAKLHNALNGGQGEDLNEEAYDLVRDIHSVLGRNASQDEVEDYLGRSLSGSELKALGFNSGRVVGYKHGQPVYAGQGQKKTYGRRY